jgi:serine/threonine protein phosphatase PrpC
MPANINILKSIIHSYIAYRRFRLLCVLVMLTMAFLLILLTGGFPPWSWRLFLQTLPHIPALLALHGPIVLVALTGLILLCVTILLTWVALFWVSWRMLAYWWYERQELRRFSVESGEAQSLAENEEEYAAQSPVSAVYARSCESLAEQDPSLHEEADVNFQDQDAHSSREATRTQFLHPVHLMSLPSYEPQYSEYAAEHMHAETIQHSMYGQRIPLMPVVLPETPPRLHTVLYDNEKISPVSSSTAITEADTHRLTTQLIVNTGLDVGLKRKGKPNEDSILALQNTRILRGCSCPVGLFVVADGMGGHDDGQRASRMVIQSLSKTVVPSVIYGPTDDNYSELLAEGIHHANLEVYQCNRAENVDMGTTVTTALVVNTTAYIANVGDSRVYLYRASSGLSQVTRDHSTVARLVETGAIKAEDIYTHPRRNEIYRSLGRRPSEEIDRFTLALQPNDLLLLCSDGLWEMVRDTQIQEIIESADSKIAQLSPALIQAALDGGGKDNISVIVVHIKLQEEQTAAWAV